MSRSPNPEVTAVDHACWSYADVADFRAYAAGYLQAGADQGEYTWYVGSGPSGRAVSGAASFVDVIAAYGAGHVVQPEAQVAAYAAATEAAVAAGYSGLRVAAEVSDLVRTDEQLDAFARYEYAINRLMHTVPFRAVCGYDRTVLGDEAIAEVACLHPRASAGAAPFHLHPGTAEGGEIILDGELDATSEDLFITALDRARPGPEVVVHGAALRFIDHRSLLTLQRYADRRDTSVVLRTPFTAAGRLASLLGLDRVQVEVIA